MLTGTPYLIGASVLWGMAHSILASHGFKHLIRQAVGSAVYFQLYRFSYNVFAAASLFPIVLMLMEFPDQPLYAIPLPWVYLTSIIQGLAAIALIVGVMQTGPLEFAGLAQLSASYGDSKPAELVTGGLYAYVRHPLYTAGLVFIWFSPEMTVNRLALWSVFTIYIIIGALFEERKLLKDFGSLYAEYKAKTPMLIPAIVNTLRARCHKS
jgi:protein-S-isoprenylcysteine O-methyltransferase Ste14